MYRDGQLYTKETIEVYDHDFPYLAEGVAIPHGIYDIGLNKAYVNIGVNHDTRDFSCDSIKRWWNFRGRYDYPGASSILILVDCGGSNGYRHLTRKLKGIILKSVEMVKELIETTTTKTGLLIKCNIIGKMYATGKKMTQEEKDSLNIIHDDYLGHWNYKATPCES